MATSETCRRSMRAKCRKRSFSPQPENKRVKRRRLGIKVDCKDYDINPSTGQKFECDECLSHFIIDPSKRKSTQNKYKPSTRYREHPETGRILTLCNSCGLRFDRAPEWPQKRVSGVSDEDKTRYRHESEQFVTALKQRFHTTEVEKLVCPNVSWKICGCIQTYIMGSEKLVSTEGASGRVQLLLSMSHEARKLSQLKHHVTNHQASNSSIAGRVGLGNGRKKSVLFHEYVLRERDHLRHACGLCERGAQAILGYSNNLLYRKLKTDQNKSRLEPRIGKSAKQLVEIDQLPKQYCCTQSCVRLARRLPVLIEEWRSRALLSQAEAGLVIAEMLTPAAASHCNCTNFIAMVTGACSGTISKVHAQLKRTGGDRQPPEHGLKQFHLQEQSKPQSLNPASRSPTSSVTTDHISGNNRYDTRLISAVGDHSNYTARVTSSIKITGDKGTGWDNAEHCMLTSCDHRACLAATINNVQTHLNDTGAVSHSPENRQIHLQQNNKQQSYNTASVSAFTMTTDGNQGTSQDNREQHQHAQCIPDNDKYNEKSSEPSFIPRTDAPYADKTSKLLPDTCSAFGNDTVTVSSGLPMATDASPGTSYQSMKRHQQVQGIPESYTRSRKSLECTKTNVTYTDKTSKLLSDTNSAECTRKNLSHLYEASKLLMEARSTVDKDSMQKYPDFVTGNSVSGTLLHWNNDENHHNLYGPKPVNTVKSLQMTTEMSQSVKGVVKSLDPVRSIQEEIEPLEITKSVTKPTRSITCTSNSPERPKKCLETPTTALQWQSTEQTYVNKTSTVSQLHGQSVNNSQDKTHAADSRSCQPIDGTETNVRYKGKFWQISKMYSEFSCGKMQPYPDGAVSLGTDSELKPSKRRKRGVKNSSEYTIETGPVRKRTSKTDKIQATEHDQSISKPETTPKRNRSSRKGSGRTKHLALTLPSPDPNDPHITSDVAHIAEVESMDAPGLFASCTSELNELLDTVLPDKQTKAKNREKQKREDGQKKPRRKRAKKSQKESPNKPETTVSENLVIPSAQIALPAQTNSVLAQNIAGQYSDNAQTSAMTYCLVSNMSGNSVPSEDISVINVPQYLPQYEFQTVQSNESSNSQNLHNAGVQFIEIVNTTVAPNTVVQLFNTNTNIQSMQQVYQS